MLKQLTKATFHHIYAVVQENGIQVLIDVLRASDAKISVKMAAEALTRIVANYPLVSSFYPTIRFFFVSP